MKNLLTMAKETKTDKGTYILTPKGWIYMIRLYLEVGKVEEAMSALEEFEKWCDNHIVEKTSPAKKKSKKKD